MNINEQVEYLMQGTEYGDETLKKKMADELRVRLQTCQKEGRVLRVYCGFDPTKADLHLGHTVPMRKLRQFQELGHDVSFVIGNYTSLIGDPSDKDVLRPQLTTEEVEANARTYAEQAFRILDPEKTHIRYNAEWLSGITFRDLIRLASNFTIQQFLTRENFKLRWEKGDPVYLHETFYSLMQGYDAYTLKADVQVGGTDQLFNIMTASRKIMEFMGLQPNIAIILGILPGTDGVVKMSKSLGNHVPINTDAADMYGKVMSIPDFAMGVYFRLVTRFTPPEIAAIENGLREGTLHPRDAKMRLAREISAAFYGEDEANKAEKIFVETFQKGSVPEEIPSIRCQKEETIMDILLRSGLVKSKSEGRRLLEQKGVRFEGRIIEDPAFLPSTDGVLQVGKRHFLKITY
ncbi:MAG TPA: tyrosine--tRNA ligase [Anaerolineaceae bacterium]|nr:tyrosine--tRNA ligase [Anaerolineaceae bacterium]HOV05776.1 tyrosine--tRNA ligase [Anaerolineaceae bacterium]